MEIGNIPRPNTALPATDVDPSLFSLVEEWPHLRELALCIQGDYIILESKYGQFQRIGGEPYEPQIYESSDADPPQVHLRKEAVIHQDLEPDEEGSDESEKILVYGGSPMLAYDPTFNWDYERTTVQGQRLAGPPNINSPSGTRFSVRILSVSIGVGLVEPLYGTICLYHTERKEKLSEDFHFQFLPLEWAGESTTEDERAIFSVEAQSPSVCLLVQLEKPATEESAAGVKSLVYSRKDPPTLTEKEAIHLQTWAQVMPFRESFAWITIPLFDSAVTGGVGGFGTPEQGQQSTSVGTKSGSATPGTPKSGSEETMTQLYDFGGPPVLVDIPHLNRVKECYTEDLVLDPKRKVNKPIRATMRFEIERLPSETTALELESYASFNAGSKTPQSFLTPNASIKDGTHSESGIDFEALQYSVVAGGLSMQSLSDVDGYRALDFQSFLKIEPLARLIHTMFVYPQAVTFPRKYNVFIRVELKTDDVDIQKPPLEAVCPRDLGGLMLRSAFSQVAGGSKTALFHDEHRIRLPAVVQPTHHFLLTFFHIDLVLKHEPPKPVVIGYAVLPLAVAVQSLKSDLSLPVVKELLPQYLEESVKKRMLYWEEGRKIFKIRTRLCSSLLPTNSSVREFVFEYNRVFLDVSAPGPDVLDLINSIKTIDLITAVQFLYPILNMLLFMIGNGLETLQVAAFRAFVSLTTRVQAETDGADRNKFLVHFVDYIFDDVGRNQTPVYPGLCNVWRSLARSKAKGYKVGPVYDEALLSAWVILEIIAKSMALELGQVNPNGGEIARLRLEEEVYQCIWQLFDCLLTEVQERAKRGGPATLAKRLNSAIAFFCYDLLSVVDPPQVFELVGVYLTKFSGECAPPLHRFKLNFLRTLCDHDFYVETPGRTTAEKNYLAGVLLKEIFVSLGHDDLSLRNYAARIFAFLICKHEYDDRYQQPELKLYISQLYFPFIIMILDEVSVYNNLGLREKRDILIGCVTVLRSLDDENLHLLWKQKQTNRLKVFFQLLDDAVNFFYPTRLQSSVAESSSEDDPSVPSQYSEKLAPTVNHFLLEASKKDPKTVLEREYLRKMSNAASGKFSIREISPQSSISRRESTRVSREGLPATLKVKLDQWESTLSFCVVTQVLRVMERFSEAVEEGEVGADYDKAENFTSPLATMLKVNQPISFWQLFPAVFSRIIRRQGREILGPGKERLVKDLAFSIMKRMVYKSDFLRHRAVLCLLLIVKTSLELFGLTHRLKSSLTVTISELIADVKLLVKGKSGSLQEASELLLLRKSIDDLGSKETCEKLLEECSSEGVEGPLDPQEELKNVRWEEVLELRKVLWNVLDASVEHARLLEGVIHSGDKYSVVESYHGLSSAYRSVADLHIIWLLHLCEAHQEGQAWAEAAQCAVAVAGVVIKVLVTSNQSVWSKKHFDSLEGIQPLLPDGAKLLEGMETLVEGYGGTNLNLDSAVKYLQMGSNFFKKCELYHFAAQLLELMLPVYRARHAYNQLARCHQTLNSIYELMLNQESSPIPFKDAAYYRVAFYGRRFGILDKKMFIYREPSDVRLGDIVQKLTALHEAKKNSDEPLSVIPDSREVDPSALKTELCYLQITAVEPVLGTEEERWMGRGPEPHEAGAPSYSCFMFDTPFTTSGKSQGGLEDQWKRRTLLYTQGTFPSMLLRLQVLKSESREYSPVDNAVSVIESRTRALANELESQVRGAIPRSSDLSIGDFQLPRLQSLQRLIQGSVALQVNSGVLGVCIAFLKEVEGGLNPEAKDPSKITEIQVEGLAGAIKAFVFVCQKALLVHSRAIGEEDKDFHLQMIEGLEALQVELTRFIPDLMTT